MISQSKPRSNLVLFVLLFLLLAVFLIHNFDSIGQDIGRHLKVGEIIWQTKEVPQNNLFSFTEPDFAFVNHHWLSEVIFFGIFSFTGFTGLILVKTFFILLVFFLLFSVFSLRSDLETEKGRTLGVAFWPLVISFLLSIFIFIQRTEVRPEVFSFAILSFFLWVLFKEKYKRPEAGPEKGRTLGLKKGSTLMWFLPLAQLFWVNLHIYFFIGPFLILAFLLDRLAAPRFDLLEDPRSNLNRSKSAIHPLENSRATSRGSRGGRTAAFPRIFFF